MRIEQNQDGREGLKQEEQRQVRHLAKAVVKSVEEDSELGRTEWEHKRKLVGTENDDGPRGGTEMISQIKAWTTLVTT